MIPAKNDLTVLFAHVAYQLSPQFELRKTGIRHSQAWTYDELAGKIAGADVLVVSGLWRNDLLPKATKLHFIQSIGAGTDQFARDQLIAKKIRLASASGVNQRAVSEHAMSLLLALARKLPEARDNQARKVWRGMIGDLSKREDELGGKTLLIIGLGGIGGRLAHLAKAFDLKVVGIKRNPATGKGAADAVHGYADVKTLLPQADFVALTCPLTLETENIIDAATLAAMKPSAYLINCARGRCVNEAALIDALKAKQIAGAAIDVTVDEPLPAASPLWTADNLLITPHTAGETRRYEDNVIDILMDNLDRLWRNDGNLRNQIA
ncbi:MAG TPA: D-2-hydroxyacid dehydrogenase [Pseudorhodoplanes sp.]|nr:D-2-hydroxyacid dehydrogenase [Pseudorhodoplanes sp.]